MRADCISRPECQVPTPDLSFHAHKRCAGAAGSGESPYEGAAAESREPWAPPSAVGRWQDPVVGSEAEAGHVPHDLRIDRRSGRLDLRCVHGAGRERSKARDWQPRSVWSKEARRAPMAGAILAPLSLSTGGHRPLIRLHRESCLPVRHLGRVPFHEGGRSRYRP